MSGEGWPEKFHVLPDLSDVAHFLGRLVSLPNGGYPSEYPKHPERRGAAAMLDVALDDYVTGWVCEGEPMDGEAIEGYAEVADQLLIPFEPFPYIDRSRT